MYTLGRSMTIELCKLLWQDTLGMQQHILPQESHNRVSQGLFAFINGWMVGLLADGAVPAFNMYSLFRLADDLASIQALADALQPTGLVVCSHTCTASYEMGLRPLQGQQRSSCAVLHTCLPGGLTSMQPLAGSVEPTSLAASSHICKIIRG